MKRQIILLISVATISLILALTGCGGSSNPPAPLEQGSVSVAIAASPGHLGAFETYQFTATVANTSNTAVTWGLSGCASACGTISASGLYAAPPFVASAATVSVTATSRADPTKSASINLVLMPISVSVAPNAPLRVPPGGTRSFTATLDHDPKNAGVTWTLSGAGCSGDSCGRLSNVTATSALYHAPDNEPSPSTVTLTATSVTDPHQHAWAAVTVSATSFLLSGKYAFLINGYHQGTLEAIAGQFDADGNGGFTGVWDANRGATVAVAQPITGNYDILSDGHGTMTIRAGSVATTYIISVDDAGATARFAESTMPPGSTSSGASGYMVRQDANYFTLSSLEDDRVIAVFGEATGSHVAALGRFTSITGGTLSGNIDLSWEIHQNVAKFPNPLFLTGSFGTPDATTGRGTASLEVGSPAAGTVTYNFAYYIVSGERVLLVQTDTRGFNSGSLTPTLGGEVRRQKNAGAFTNASFNLPAVFHLTDATWRQLWDDHPMIRVGRMVPNGSGSLNFTFDQNRGGTIKLNETTTSTYSVSANGRVTWDAPEKAIAYLVDQNNGYFMSQDGDGAGFGTFGPQTSAPFNIGSLAGTFLLNTGPPAMEQAENDAGWITLDANGTATATLYVNTGSGATPYSLTGSASIASNGRGTLALNTTPPSVPRQLVFWAISPTRCVAVSAVDPGDTEPVLFYIERSDGSD